MLLVDRGRATFLPSSVDKATVVLVRDNDTIVGIRKEVERLLRCPSESELVLAARGGHLQLVKSLIGPANQADRNASLLEAAKNDRSDVVEYLLKEAEVNANASNPSGVTALHYAAGNGDATMVSMLLDKNAWMEARTSMGETPLYLAAQSGSIEVSEMLLAAGAEVDAKTRTDWTPLVAAADSVKLLRLLVSHGAKPSVTAMVESARAGSLESVVFFHSEIGIGVNARGNNGETPLLAATGANNTDIARYLLEQGASADAFDADHVGTVFLAAKNGNLELLKLLLLQNNTNQLVNQFSKPDGGEKTKQYSDTQMTPLQVSAMRGHLEVVRFLLGHGADINATSDVGNSGLHLSAEFGHHEVFALLLDFGADMYQLNHREQLPPHYAVEYNHTEVIRVVVEKGFDLSTILNGNRGTILHDAAYFPSEVVVRYLTGIPEGLAILNTTDRQGYIALHLINLGSGSVVIGELLVSAGSALNAMSGVGETPLALAVKFGWLELTRLYVEKGADVNLADLDLRSPLHKACEFGHTEVAESLLLSNAVVVDARDTRGVTPLMLAAALPSETMAEMLLLRYAANPLATDKAGRSVLHWAAAQGRTATVKLLLGSGADPAVRSVQGKTAKEEAERNGFNEVALLL